VAQVPAPTPKGYAPALVVRVGGREYTRADSLLDLPPEARVYRFAADTPVGTLVEFPGPLPAGQAVTAEYRGGGGPQGNVAAGRLTTVTTPVPGLRGATNPFAASGGTAAESPDDLRRALPASVRTLGRAVAREDFEAFALDYRGVGKALATELRQGMRRVLCLTIADSAFESPQAGSSLPDDLRKALLAACPPGLAIRIEGFDALTARVDLAYAHDPSLERTAVDGALRQALLARFSPAARPFGEALHRAQVLAAAQAVPGVLACRLTRFTLGNGPAEDQGRLLCPQPRFEAQPAAAPPLFRRGGLIALADAELTFAEMAP
jgi:predicted phage baseplate assembly protein